jgi:hypothetical protein
MVLPLIAVLIQTLAGTVIDALQAPAGTKAIVFIFASTDCPISNRYAPEVRRLAEKFSPRHVVFRLVYPNPADTAAAIREHMTAFAYQSAAQAFRDPDHGLVKLAQATVTPEAAVFVAGRLVYHGRIDDRYVDFGVDRAAPTVHDLDEAIAAAIKGEPVPQESTRAIGCYIADFRR